jgi:NAD(P)H-binding
MNVTVFGATGAIGSLTVNELLANGHTVTAYSRHPNKIPPEWGDRVRVIIGELSDAEAVVSALGPSLDRKATGLPLVDGTRHIVDAMNGTARPALSATPLPASSTPREAHLADQAGHLHGTHRPPQCVPGTDRHDRSDSERRSGLDDRPLHRPEEHSEDREATGRVLRHDRIGFAVSRADIAAFTFEQTSRTSPPTRTSWSSPFRSAGSPTCRCHLSPTASSST